MRSLLSLFFSRLKNFRSLRLSSCGRCSRTLIIFFCSVAFSRRSMSLELRSPELGPDTWDKWPSSFAQKFYYCFQAVLKQSQWSQVVSVVLASCTTAYLKSLWIGMLYNRKTTSDSVWILPLDNMGYSVSQVSCNGADPEHVNSAWKAYLTLCFLISAKLQFLFGQKVQTF